MNRIILPVFAAILAGFATAMLIWHGLVTTSVPFTSADWRAHQSRGMAAYERDDLVSAEKEFRAAYNCRSDSYSHSLSSAWLAHALKFLGRTREAEKFDVTALSYCRDSTDAAHNELGLQMCNLAGCYIAECKFSKAEALLNETLKLKTCHGILKAFALHGLGLIAFETGRYPQAEKLLESSLKSYRGLQNVEGGEGEIAALNDLGNLYLKLGRYEQAENVLREGLANAEKGPGASVPTSRRSTSRVMSDLAIVCSDRGNYNEAEKLFAKALRIRQQCNYAPIANFIKNDFANHLMRQHRYKEAKILLGEVLGIRQSFLGDKHILTANTKFSLARIYEQEGSIAKAKELYTEVLQTRQKLLGDQHPDTLEAARNQTRLAIAN